jgi:hypothetical protein
MKESFSKQVAASLPPQVRRRYAAELDMMERCDALIATASDAWSRGRRGLGKSCRAAARMLDGAAQRLLLNR